MAGCAIAFGMLAAPVAVSQAATPKATIYSFQGGADGGIPEAALSMDTDGALYGVSSGGPMGSGIVYKLTPPAAGATQWTKTTLYAFRGGADGGFPQAGLIFDSNGALYGVTREGGANGAGTVFSLSQPLALGGAWTKTTLYSFKGGADGAQPLTGLTMDTDGALYGTTNQQGASGAGIVYMLVPPVPGSTVWTKRTLYTFKGGLDGSNPYGGVVFDTSGALYGTTAFGGHRGAGTVYRLAPPAPGTSVWTKATLYSFDGVEGNFPRATVTFGTDAAIYGVTYGGGAFNAGTVYRLAPPAPGATAWTKTTLYNFNGGSEGSNPYSEVTFDTTGALYGADYKGGASGAGVIFKLTPPAAAGATLWNGSVVYSFQGGQDGQNPGGLAFDAKGSIYGVTMYGANNWNGSVFYIDLPPPAPVTKPAAENVVYGFTGKAGDGGNPLQGTPLFDTKGGIFAATSKGGARGKGAIVRLNPPTRAVPRWTQTVLYSFTGGADGDAPLGCLTLDTDGALHGATAQGGRGHGVAFQLNPPTSRTPAWTYRTIYTFTGGEDGSQPQCEMVFDSKGSLYGVTRAGGKGFGVAFRLKPNNGTEWQYNLLYSFTGKTDGAYPASGVAFDTDGDLYGVTTEGGAGSGVIYRLRPGEHNVNSKFWTQSVLYTFKGGADGARPWGVLTSDNKGSFYGVTHQGGAGFGTAFSLSQKDDKWSKTTLYSFRGAVDGATPYGLTFDTLGALYGTTELGGAGGKGTAFKLTPPASGATWVKSTLNSFNGEDGATPLSGMVFDTQGALYGMTSLGGAGGSGVIFRLK